MTYVVTAQGKRLSLIDPDPAVIEFDDIADRLALMLRYGGLPMTPISVARHTLLVAAIATKLMPTAGPYALLHDAHEAFLGDWITPVKMALAFGGTLTFGGKEGRIKDGFLAAAAIQRLEQRMATAIHMKARLSFPPPPLVAEAVIEADRTAHATEVAKLIPSNLAKEFDTADLPEPEPEALKLVMRLDPPAAALKQAFHRAFVIEAGTFPMQVPAL